MIMQNNCTQVTASRAFSVGIFDAFQSPASRALSEATDSRPLRGL